MAISTQDIDFTDPIRNLGPDSTTFFGEPPSNRTEHLSSENLEVPPRVDDDDEDDMEDDEDDEDDEDEDEDEGRKTSTMRRTKTKTKTRMKTMKMRMTMKRMTTTKTWTNFRFASVSNTTVRWLTSGHTVRQTLERFNCLLRPRCAAGGLSKVNNQRLIRRFQAVARQETAAPVRLQNGRRGR